MNQTEKHSNIALFIPHNGCPHACSFCDQREITGQAYQPDAADVAASVQTAEKSLGSALKNAEIAFFGGSFTAIDRAYMTELLQAAAPYVKSSRVAGIRISTRPDAIDDEILTLLKEYGVTAIELGAQSMCDDVLSMNHRGHTVQHVVDASRLIRQYGFSLGLQMMTGLYGSSPDKDRATARAIAALSPDTVRIYPTVVMKGTQLYELYRSGAYRPQGTEEAVELCAELLEFFELHHIAVIRLGLHDSDSLRENMAAGAYHPAFRELCESEIMYRHAVEALKKRGITEGMVDFYVNPKSVSRFIGQKRKNLVRLNALGITAIVRQDYSMEKYEVCARRYI